MQRNQGNSVLGAALMLLALLLMPGTPGHAQERAHPLRVTYDSLPGEWTGHRDGLGGTAILMFEGGRPMDRDGAFIEVFDQGVGSIPASLAEFRQYDFDDTLDWQYEPFEVSGYRGYVARGQRGHRGATVYYIQVGSHRVMLLADLRGPNQSKWRQEADLVISRLRFCCAPPVAAPPATGLRPCRAVIHLPVDLQPGQVLSPSYTITDANGGPPVGEVQVRLRINGGWTNSVIWDGNEAVVELQASCHGFPLSVTAIMPAYGTPPPGDVPDVLPSPQEWLDRELLPLLTAMAAGLDAIPPMGSIGDLPGPADMTQALVGVLAPGLVAILIGLLGGHAPAPPGSPTTGGGPAEGPRSGPNDQENGPPPPRSAAETAAGLAPSRRPLTVIGGLQLPDFPEFPPDPGIAGGTPLLEPTGRDTMAERIQDTVEAFTENPYVIETSRTILDVSGAVKDGVVGFTEGVISIPGAILEGYNQIRLDVTELIQDYRSGRSSFGDMGSLWVAKETLGSIWRTLGREILPIEELSSFWDEHASSEEKLWAIPAIAVKCARLLMIAKFIGKDYTTASVPGTEKLPSLIPSAKLKHELAREAARQSARVGELKQQIQSLQSGKAGLKPGKLRSALRSAQEELARATSEEAATNAVIQALNKGGLEAQQAYESYMAKSKASAQGIANDVASTGAVPEAKVLEAMRNPAEMRTLKEASQSVQRAFNQTQTKIYSATNKDVVDYLQTKSPGVKYRPGGVRTPGQSSLINTDNDAIFQKWIPQKGGGGYWKEVPASEWEAAYNKSFAGHSGYSLEQAKKLFPGKKWEGMTRAQQHKAWAEGHGQACMDVKHPEALQAFSSEKTVMKPGMRAGGKSSIARGARPTDPEQLKLGYKYKTTHGWEQGKGSFVVETEAMEQGVKMGKLAKKLAHDSYRRTGHVPRMSDMLRKGEAVVNKRDLCPLVRDSALKELGFRGGYEEYMDKLSTWMGSLP